jgi:hypothetical protein
VFKKYETSYAWTISKYKKLYDPLWLPANFAKEHPSLIEETNAQINQKPKVWIIVLSVLAVCLFLAGCIYAIVKTFV